MLGDVYCSEQHEKSMNDMSTGTLYIKSKVLEETCEHISRLSIRCMLNGKQHYKVGGKEYLVHADNYLIVNRGQRYQTSFRSDTEQEMILVAFQPGFAEKIWYTVTASGEKLLDDPFGTSSTDIRFFENTYPADPVVMKIFSRLRKMTALSPETRKDMYADAMYENLLTRILVLQGNMQKEMRKLGAVKQSTREELYRRLYIARDYADANYHNKTGLEEIAHAACLSVHHFKREFKSLFGVAPHKYVFNKRIDKAKSILRSTGESVNVISGLCGFENTSSFIRQFKTSTGKTPGEYRQENYSFNASLTI